MRHFLLSDAEFQVLFCYLLHHILWNFLGLLPLNFITKFWNSFLSFATFTPFILPGYLRLVQVVGMLGQVWSKAAYAWHCSGYWMCILVLCILFLNCLLVCKSTSYPIKRQNLRFSFFWDPWLKILLET